MLKAHHEEADTRLVLHSIHSKVNIVVVASHDTEVLILLIAHFKDMSFQKLWMKTGPSKLPKYILVHQICCLLPA